MKIPEDHEQFYAELVARNAGLISPKQQELLRTSCLVLAGCGSTGGACAMPLLRSGAEHFVLLDPGDYELNNLNRQDATVSDIGQNKAQATSNRMHLVNPFVNCTVHKDGVTPKNANSVIKDASLIIDAVDVTTESGVRAKYALHQSACKQHLVVLTAYDIAGTQFLELYDYRKIHIPLRGRVVKDADPDAALRKLIPPWVLPKEIFPVLLLRQHETDFGFPQLAMTSTLFGSLIVPYTLRILCRESVPTRLRFDLNSAVRPWNERPTAVVQKMYGLISLLRKLRD